jgi:hypothetical protein
MSWEFQMSSHLQRSLTANETRLSVLLRNAANLNLQLHELNELRYRVKQAELIAQESQRTGQSGKMSVEGRLICIRGLANGGTRPFGDDDDDRRENCHASRKPGSYVVPALSRETTGVR